MCDPIKGFYLGHPSSWKEDVINIKLRRLNEPLHSYYIYTNCVNNKMLEYDWFLTAHIYSLILLCNSKTVRFDLSDYQKLVIGQVKSDS